MAGYDQKRCLSGQLVVNEESSFQTQTNALLVPVPVPVPLQDAGCHKAGVRPERMRRSSAIRMRLGKRERQKTWKLEPKNFPAKTITRVWLTYPIGQAIASIQRKHWPHPGCSRVQDPPSTPEDPLWTTYNRHGASVSTSQGLLCLEHFLQAHFLLDLGSGVVSQYMQVVEYTMYGVRYGVQCHHPNNQAGFEA
jgi:hypothetical protein